MRLTQNEETHLLKAVLSKNGLSVSAGMALVKREEEGRATAAEVSVLNRLTRQINEAKRAASIQKREHRGNTPYRALAKRLAVNPLVELKACAKSEYVYQQLKVTIADRTKISRVEAVVLFTGTKESSEQPLSKADIERMRVMDESRDLVNLAVRRCKAMGFTVV